MPPRTNSAWQWRVPVNPEAPRSWFTEHMIQDLHHVNIHVDDLQAAETFYMDVLGLKRLERPLSTKGAWLMIGETRQLHLSVKEVPRDLQQHFAFQVESVDRVHDRLAEADYPIDAELEIPGVCRQIFVLDPAGNRVEFNQPL